jgi:threonine/homoserine/homoserine lactone efflux protein
MWVYLIQGIGYGFAAAAQPGPFQTYLITQTLSKGWRHALPAALAPLMSDGPIILLALAVLSQVPVWFQRFLYIAGGLFIFYLAYSAFVTWRNFDEASVVKPSVIRQSVGRAAIVNVLSPGPYIYWSPVYGIGFLVSFYAAIVLSLSGIIVVFGTARRLGPKVNRLLLFVSAIALAGFGLYQLWLGIGSGWLG